MSILLSADLHFTDQARDAYRWDLIPWLRDQVIEKEISQVIFLGDVLDQKDRHPATLVNRLIEQLSDLAKHCDVIILMGNHDAVDLKTPFLKFIESFQSNLVFISDITTYWLNLPGHNTSIECLFLPATKNWREDWQRLDFNKYDLIFTHATYDGAKAETGVPLPGIPPSTFRHIKGHVWSGDIHGQQDIGKKISYVGSPYHVRFGDTFCPRVVWLDNNLKSHDLKFPCLSKHVLVITELTELDHEAQKLGINPGDQVKVRVRLPRSQYPSWNQIKAEIKDKAQAYGWELFGPELLPLDTKNPTLQITAYKSSEEILAEYIKAKKLSQRQAEIGLSLLRNP